MIALILSGLLAVQIPGALQPGTGVVTGILKTADGRAAAGVRVGAVDSDDPTASSLLSVTETDSAGRYRLTNIPAGRYYIVAGRLTDLHYFPAGGDRSSAAVVEVEPARIRADVNFTVPTGSQRPPSVAGAGSKEETAYRKVRAESDVERKAQLLLEFEANFPRSSHLAEVYASLMNIYAGRNDARRTIDYAEKAIRTDPDGVASLIQVSRMYALLLKDTTRALQYAEKAATIAAKVKNQSPPSITDPAAWRRWADSMASSAQSNLVWVKQMDAWQRDAQFSLVTPKRSR
jgi:tetratricopeptide (TPR) repeat protein